MSAPLRAQAPAWSSADAQDLLSVVEAVGQEGLDPADYRPEQLRAAIATGDEAAINGTASALFVRVADAFSHGHVPADARVAWHIAGPLLSSSSTQAMLSTALARHQVAPVLRALLPHAEEYQRLKAALAATPPGDRDRVARIRASLERWRWMPRLLGERYIVVNIPSFELTVFDDGRAIERHKIITGKTATPTPQFSASVEAVLFNPWWEVPPSIVRESIGKLVRTNPAAARSKGYVASGGRIRQRPGPDNSLGQIKLVMPNPFTVYVHDTPSKQLFQESVRAYSHGCIRTQNPYGLAETLLAARPGWERSAIDAVVQSRAPKQVTLPRPVPIFVTYFTAMSDDKGVVIDYPDVYGRDAPVFAALTDQPLPPVRPMIVQPPSVRGKADIEALQQQP